MNLSAPKISCADDRNSNGRSLCAISDQSAAQQLGESRRVTTRAPTMRGQPAFLNRPGSREVVKGVSVLGAGVAIASYVAVARPDIR
jgi:hypothetical protein